VRIAAIVLTILLPATAAAAPVDVSIGSYHAVIDTSAAGTDIFRLYRSDELVRQEDGLVRLWLGPPAQAPGTDVNADGVPDLVLSGWSGGAHCCFVTWVFSLGEEFAVLAEIIGDHAEAEIRQADADPALEFAVSDWALAYWPFDFAGSPSVEVILDWQGRVLQPSAPLTLAALELPSDPDALARRYAADAAWSDQAYDPICGLFATALNLVYAGQADRAAMFIADAWGGDRSRLVRLTMEFGRRLEGSRYLGEIERQRRAGSSGAR
jgi:hypothetical protein